MDLGLATLLGVLITSLASLGGILLTWFLTNRQNKKIDETHHMVTVNGGKSPEPTVLDHLSDIKSDVTELKTRVTEIERKIESE